MHFTDTDLTIGLLFILDDELINHEFFPQRGRGIDLFPVHITMQNVANFTVFEPDDLFEIGATEDAFGRRLYWLSPILAGG